jgi:hypothetical protein
VTGPNFSSSLKSPLRIRAVAMGACASTPPPVPSPAPVVEAPRRRVRVAEVQRAPGVRGLVEEFRALRDVPDDVTGVPEAARGPLRALRQGLRTWLLEAVREAGRVPPRVQLRAELDDMTRRRPMEDQP